MENKIDLLMFNDKLLAGSRIMIVGYADYLGSEGYNQGLSMKRAENVKKYLVKYGLNPKDIELCLGKGKVERSGLTSREGFPTVRRVDIVVNNGVKKIPTKPSKPVKDTKVDLTDIGELKRLKPGTVFKLQNVYFPSGRHVIMQESYKALEKLYSVLNDNPGIKVRIEGHVCCIPAFDPDAIDDDTGQLGLSINRAREIYNYLVDKGIEKDRLSYIGFGKSHPVSPIEFNEEEKAKNRRVEIRITENNGAH
jgi:outer membrane protein OmpA-like peptidoglycan-associated protein